ncbi:MAG: MBL fold metallo-hydrolase [Hyphomicrobiales bacterium]|nr:MBL fold metallo-hydrolase [Hyphomicrobiales bacterium]
MRIITIVLASLLSVFPANAFEVQKVTEGIYALVGEKNQRSPTNLANNSTHGVIVTGDGVVLVDPGGSWKGAQRIHEEIAKITDKPVKIVINSGGQDHRWLGNGYWKTQGAKIIASEAAVEDHKDRGSLQMSVLDNLIGKELDGTEPVYADTVFNENYSFKLGGLAFEITHAGQAHTPGDSFIWVPEKMTVLTGDIVYVERILGIGSQSHSGEWIEVFNAMAKLEVTHVVPGHGHATNMEKAKADTLDYLVNLRETMRTYMDAGGEIIGSVNVDQSKFSYLEQFENLAKRNAQQVFTELEFE